MRALVLLVVAGLLIGCMSTTRTREVHCLGTLLMDVSESKQDMEEAHREWHAVQEARADRFSRPWYGFSESRSEGGAIVVSGASMPRDTDFTSSRYVGGPDPIYDRLIQARARHHDALTWYTRLARRVQTRLEEDDILYPALSTLLTSPVSLVFYPVIRWNVRSVLWDGADPDADDDPIQQFCATRLN